MCQQGLDGLRIGFKLVRVRGQLNSVDCLPEQALRESVVDTCRHGLNMLLD